MGCAKVGPRTIHKNEQRKALLFMSMWKSTYETNDQGSKWMSMTIDDYGSSKTS